MKANDKFPIIIKKIQSCPVVSLDLHEVQSKKFQTTRHTVREIYLRTTFFLKK